mgnify:CR=1 FL=1
MTLTQCGPRCDVCSDYILLDRSINPFVVTGIVQELHCHDRCKPLVLETMSKKDWKLLPVGPLREAYERESVKGG